MNNKLFPFFQGIFPIKASGLTTEVIAGITLAALAIPEVLGYTKISGTPLITGLYTLIIPMLLYAVLGSSRHLVVGADSATAAILASSLIGLAAVGSHEYVALASLLALLAAALLIIARMIGVGFMADFLSRTVLIGFLTGVGIHIALGQISGMLGIPGGGHGSFGNLISDLRRLDQTNLGDMIIAFSVIVVILVIRKFSRKVPGALIAVVASIMIGMILNLKNYGIHTLGEIPRGLPMIAIPDVPWSFALILKLLPTAFSMFVVILAQSAATSRAYSAKYNEPFCENLDLVGLGFANIGAALSGTFVVNGSPTKTQMVDSAGGRSQLSQVITSLIVVLVLLFFTSPLRFMPSAVLSAVVFVIGLELIDIKGMNKVWRERQAEFWVALATCVVVVLIGVEQGIVIAMVLSLIEHVRRSYRSQNIVLAKDTAGAWLLLPVTSPQDLAPGLLVYRFAHTIYYANAPQFYDQVINLSQKSGPSLSWFCIDASAVADIDFTAAETIREVYAVLQSRGIRLVWTNVIVLVRRELDNYEITSLMGKDAFYESLGEMLEAYHDRTRSA